MNISMDELVLGKNKEQTSTFEEQVVQQKNGNRRGYLIGIIAFFIAVVCWIISCILNISNSNDIAATLNVVCIIVLIFPIVFLLKKYRELK